MIQPVNWKFGYFRAMSSHTLCANYITPAVAEPEMASGACAVRPGARELTNSDFVASVWQSFEEQPPRDFLLLSDFTYRIFSLSAPAYLWKCKPAKVNKVRKKKELFESRIYNDSVMTGALSRRCCDSACVVRARGESLIKSSCSSIRKSDIFSFLLVIIFNSYSSLGICSFGKKKKDWNVL